MVEDLTDPEVRAAGGVVWRLDPDDRLEVLLVHRPRYDDWTFPKGKAHSDDVDDEHTARREVAEEAGLECALGRELPSTSYRDNRGRFKVVRYWEMRPLAGAFVPNREVDTVAWLPVQSARIRLTYEHDRVVLDAVTAFAG